MLLMKSLPTVREPRLYLSMERSYLASIKFLFVAFGTGILSKKLTLLLGTLHFDLLVPFFQDLYYLLTWPVLALLFLVFYLFISDLRYVNKGAPVTAREIQDPRIYLSAERTFLAWIRTGISIVIFGFVIAKFNFFLSNLALILHTKITLQMTFAGMDVVFVVLGVISISMGTVGFFLTLHQVDHGAYRPHVTLYAAYGLSFFVAMAILGYQLFQVGGSAWLS